MILEMANKTNGINGTAKEDRERPKCHKLSLTCLCVDSKGRYAFTASKDGSIIKWCLTNRKILAKVNAISKKEYEKDPTKRQEHHTRHINCMAISSDDQFLASGGWDKNIRIWNPHDMSWIHTFNQHRQEITSLAFRRGHPTLYSGSADKSVMLWTLEEEDNRCFIEALYGHESAVTSLDSLGRERVLSSGGRDQTIRIWKIVEQAQTVFESKHQSADVARYIDDKTLVSGGEDGTISIWTTMKRTPVFSLENAHNQTTTNGVANESEIDQKVRCCWISALATYSMKEPTKNQSVKRRKLNEDVGASDDDKESEAESDGDPSDELAGTNSVMALVASGSCDSKLKVWKLIKSGSKYELKLHQIISCAGFINDIRFTSDGKKIVAALGQEHKFGRWWRLKDAKNRMEIFDVDAC